MTKIWFDGAIVPQEDIQVTILAHTLHYGVGVFEGIRSYARSDGSAAVFRLDDHMRRFEESARICGLRLPVDRHELARAAVAVVEANELRDAYIRPIAYQDDGTLAGLGSNPTVHVAVAALPWGAYLGEDGLRRGIRVRVSTWRRAGPGAFLPRAKICGQYVNSTLAKREALAMGLDEALLQDEQGYIVEGSGENLFLVQGGELITPPASSAILLGLTRDTVMHLARELADDIGLRAVREERIPRDMLFVADEVFLTGTAAEVTPVREIDGRAVGNGRPGPVTKKLQDAFFEVVRGRAACPQGWRTAFGALVP